MSRVRQISPRLKWEPFAADPLRPDRRYIGLAIGVQRKTGPLLCIGVWVGSLNVYLRPQPMGVPL